MAKPVKPPKRKTSPGQPFEAAGPLVWAVLAPIDAPTFEAHVLRANAQQRPVFIPDLEDDEPRSWQVVQGTKRYSALIETEPGSDAGDIELATALSKELATTLYALGFSGYDDPDHGLPYITRYDRGTSGLIWMAPSYDDEAGELETVAGPKGVPCEDPFAFGDALGCKLRKYYDR